MVNHKGIFGIFFSVSILYVVYCFVSETTVEDKTLLNEYTLLSENEAVNISGCRTYQPPKVVKSPIYPSLRKNFVTRLCALEVFPSNDLIALRDLNVDEVVKFKYK